MNQLAPALALLLAFSGVALAADNSSPETPNNSSESAQPPKTMGIATMREDRTIIMRVRTLPPAPPIMAEFDFAPGEAMYDRLLAHVGGLMPGETKLIPPWPDEQTRPPPDGNPDKDPNQP